MSAIIVEGRRINPPQLVGDRSRFGQRGSVYSTVNNHASNAFRKLGARSTVEMMNLMGWVRVER